MMDLPNNHGTAALPTLGRPRQTDSDAVTAKTRRISEAEAEAAKNRAFAVKVNILVGIGIAAALLAVAMMYVLPLGLPQ